MAKYQEMHVHKGSDIKFPVQIFEADGLTPQDITGWTLEWKAGTTDLPADAFITKTPPITDAVLGKLDIDIARADTTSQSVGGFRQGLARIDSGSRTPLIFGPFILLESING